MKNSKKILSLSMAATMLAGSTTAFAMPADVIVLGDKAFEILALSETDNTELQAEINAALDATDAEGMFYRLGSTGDFKKLAEDDVVMTAAQQTALKNVVLTKADGTKETYANFEDETGTVVEQADLTAYNAAKTAKVEANYTAESWVIYQKVITDNPVTTSNTQAEVDAATAKIIEAQKALVSVNGLAVESVSAINLKQVKVKFSKAVDKTTAETKANYLFDGSASLGASDAVELLEDGETVLVTFNSAKSPQSTQKIKAKSVKSLDKSETLGTMEEVEVTYNDFTTPTVTGNYELVGPKTLRVAVSEPLASVTAAKIIVDNGAYAVSSTTAYARVLDANYVDIQLGADLAAGDHTIKFELGAITDAASFKNAAEQTISVNVAPVADNVTYEVVEATQTSVKIKFSADVKVSDIDTSLFYHSFTTYVPDSVVAKDTSATYEDEYTLTFNTYPLSEGTVNLFVLKTNTAGSKKVEDAFGNTFATDSVKMPVTVAADTTAPSIVSVTATDSTHVEVVFDEAVTAATAQTKANYTFKDANGAVITTSPFDTAGHPTNSPTLSADGKTATITLAAALNGGNYQVEIKGIKDVSLAANAMGIVTQNFVVADQTPPALTGATLYSDNKTVVVNFSEEMSTTGLTTLTNYQLNINGTATDLPSGATITAAADAKSVTIVLPNTITNLDGTIDKVYVTGIKDVSGTSVAFGENYAISAASGPALFDIDSTGTTTYAELTGEQTVKVYLNKSLLSLDSALITLNGSAIGGATFTNTNVTDGTNTVAGAEVTITLPAKVTTTDVTNGLAGDIAFAANALTASNGAKNTGTLTVAKASNVVDKLAPSVKEDVKAVKQVKALDLNSNGIVDTISIEYTEKIDAATLSTTTFAVDGKTVETAKLDENGTATKDLADADGTGKYVLLDVKEATSTDTNAVFTVSQNSAIKDGAGNTSALLAATNTIDTSKPVMVSSSAVDADKDGKVEKITIDFSEPVTASTTTTDYTVELVGTTTAIGVSSVSILDSDSVVLNLDTADTNQTTGALQVTVSADKVKDANNISASLTDAAVTDDAAPVLLTAVNSDSTDHIWNYQDSTADILTLTFSEAMDDGSNGDINLADLNTLFNVYDNDQTTGINLAGTGAVGTLAITDGAKTATITVKTANFTTGIASASGSEDYIEIAAPQTTLVADDANTADTATSAKAVSGKVKVTE